ncbi:hypothetical protein [Peribacillus asahii]|uniref:hypothetical protein n=1 Tax=Peribacillus asahii TaxID=228899 RepID=UPI002079A3E2|nr:hypothetical protein [Peribacillus asahii]USK70012.1 hypothetical protein LIS76_21285 [Peribacillus asahii]
MKKKKAIKLSVATAIAASAFAGVPAIQSEAATNSVDKAITKATTQVNKAFNLYYNTAKKSGKLPSGTAIRKEVKLAEQYYAAAQKEIAAKGGSKKASYTKKLEASKTSLNRAKNYVAAVSVTLKASRTALDSAIKSGSQSKVLAAQTALDKKIAEFEKAVAKVFGPDARRLLTKTYTTPAKAESASVATEMKVYAAYKQIEREDLIATDLEKAGEVIESVKAEVEELKAKDSKLAENILKAVEKNNAKYEAALVPVVKSVTAINAKTIEVKFSSAIDAKTLKNAGADVITVAAGEGASNAGTVTQELSEDGKTLTLKADADKIFKGEYTVKVPFEIVKGLDGKFLSPVNAKVTVNDTAAPVLTAATSTIKDTKDGVKQITLTFDEEVKSIDTVKINGVNYSAAVSGKTATVNVDLDASKTYDVQVVNATDAAGNVKTSQVAPLTVSVDNVAPSIVSVVAAGENKVTVTLDKELEGDKLAISGKVGTFSADVVEKVEVNAKNKKEYTLTLDKAYLFKNGNSDTVTLTVAKEALVDTLGNKNASEITKTVVVSKDATAPQAVKVATSTTDGKVTSFSVTYNEEVTNPTTAKIAVVNSKGEILSASNVVAKAEVSKDDAKTVVFTLATGLATDKYSFDLAEGFVTDTALTANNSSKYAFDVEVTEAGKPVETSFDIKGATAANNVITVDFGAKVKATGTGSALNPSAYQVNGVTLPSDTTITFGEKDSAVDQTSVVITLPAGFVKANDDKSIFRVTDVQTLDNKVSNAFTKIIEVTDNTAPEVKSIVATDLTKVTVTYSEAIKLTVVDAVITDEIALVDSKGAAVSFSNPEVTTDGKLVLTVEDATKVNSLTTLKVETAENANIVDGNGVAQKAGLTVSK